MTNLSKGQEIRKDNLQNNNNNNENKRGEGEIGILKEKASDQTPYKKKNKRNLNKQ